MLHYVNGVMSLCVYVGKYTWFMYVGIYVCIGIHIWKYKYIFMQADMHECVCMYF